MSRKLSRLPGFFSIDELAALDNSTRMNVAYAIRTGKLPAVRVGSHPIISERDAVEYLSRNKSAPKTGRPRKKK